MLPYKLYSLQKSQDIADVAEMYLKKVKDPLIHNDWQRKSPEMVSFPLIHTAADKPTLEVAEHKLSRVMICLAPSELSAKDTPGVEDQLSTASDRQQCESRPPNWFWCFRRLCIYVRRTPPNLLAFNLFVFTIRLLLLYNWTALFEANSGRVLLLLRNFPHSYFWLRSIRLVESTHINSHFTMRLIRSAVLLCSFLATAALAANIEITQFPSGGIQPGVPTTIEWSGGDGVSVKYLRPEIYELWIANLFIDNNYHPCSRHSR